MPYEYPDVATPGGQGGGPSPSFAVSPYGWGAPAGGSGGALDYGPPPMFRPYLETDPQWVKGWGASSGSPGPSGPGPTFTQPPGRAFAYGYSPTFDRRQSLTGSNSLLGAPFRRRREDQYVPSFEGGLYEGSPFARMANRGRGAIAASDTYANLLLGGGAGTMFDPLGNYEPYLGELEATAGRTGDALMRRSRLAAMLSPDVDPSQRNYAGLLGEASSFGGTQELVGGARRGLAERNQAYLMNLLQQLYESQTGADVASQGEAANLRLQKEGRPKWWETALGSLAQGAGAGAAARAF